MPSAGSSQVVEHCVLGEEMLSARCALRVACRTPVGLELRPSSRLQLAHIVEGGKQDCSVSQLGEAMRRKDPPRRHWCASAVVTVCLLLLGCNANESKEGRIRHLEAEVLKATEEIEDLERRVKLLESKPEDTVE